MIFFKQNVQLNNHAKILCWYFFRFGEGFWAFSQVEKCSNFGLPFFQWSRDTTLTSCNQERENLLQFLTVDIYPQMSSRSLSRTCDCYEDDTYIMEFVVILGLPNKQKYYPLRNFKLCLHQILSQTKLYDEKHISLEQVTFLRCVLHKSLVFNSCCTLASPIFWAVQTS